MTSTLRYLAVVVLVWALLAVSLGGVIAQSTGDGIEPADEIYVHENGDVVLRYAASPSPDAPETLEFGVNVAENLAYGLVTDPVDDTPDVRYRIDLAATRTTMEGEGGLSVPSPEGLQAFSLEASAESTDQTASSDLSLSAAVRDTSGATGFVKSVGTAGRIETGPDGIAADGTLDVRANLPLGASQSLSATLQEGAAGYTLAVDWDRPVDERTAAEWQDRERATRLLERQFGAIANQLGGSATVQVDRVEATQTDTGFRLRQVYTARFSGIDAGLESLLRTMLAENQQVDREQVDRLATALTAVEVREASIDYTVEGRNLNGSIRLDVRNYADLVLAYIETLDALDPRTAGSIDRARAQFQARQAAGLTQTVTWDAGLGHPESGVVEVNLDAESATENRAAYVDELRARDLPVLTQEFGFSGTTDGGRLEFDGRGSVEGEALFDTLLAGLPAADELPPRSAAIVEGLRESDPDRAKLVGSYDGDGLRLEAGAAFGDLGAFRDALANSTGVPQVTEVIGRLGTAGDATYLRVDGATARGATESDIRTLPYVDSGTTVHLPGTWDREFPAMDLDRARSFLSDVGPGSSGPGFGPAMAVVAVIVIAVILHRRT